MTVLTLWVFLPFGFKRLSCLLLHVLDALAEDDDALCVAYKLAPRMALHIRLHMPR